MAEVARTALALAVGSTALTAFVTMNTTFNYMVFPGYYLPVAGSKSSSPQSSSSLLLRQWSLTYTRGHAIGPTSLILATGCFVYAGVKVPELRSQMICATISAAMGFFFTIAFIIPVNLKLFKRADAVENTSHVEEQEKIAAGDTQALIAKCLWLSKLRAVMPVPGIVLGLYSLFKLVELRLG